MALAIENAHRLESSGRVHCVHPIKQGAHLLIGDAVRREVGTLELSRLVGLARDRGTQCPVQWPQPEAEVFGGERDTLRHGGHPPLNSTTRPASHGTWEMSARNPCSRRSAWRRPSGSRTWTRSGSRRTRALRSPNRSRASAGSGDSRSFHSLQAMVPRETAAARVRPRASTVPVASGTADRSPASLRMTSSSRPIDAGKVRAWLASCWTVLAASLVHSRYGTSRRHGSRRVG